MLKFIGTTIREITKCSIELNQYRLKNANQVATLFIKNSHRSILF